MVEGLRACEEVLASPYRFEQLLYCPHDLTGDRAERFLAECRRRRVPVEEIAAGTLRKISDTVHSQGIIGVVAKRPETLPGLQVRQPRLVLALDRVSDPGNAGTIVRTAHWFGVGALIFSEDSVESTNPKVVRASMGALFHVPILEDQPLTETLTHLRGQGYAVFVAHAGGEVSYREASFSDRDILVVGNEIDGVREPVRRLATATLHIPGVGRGDSLNVAVATGILLAEMTKTQPAV